MSEVARTIDLRLTKLEDRITILERLIDTQCSNYHTLETVSKSEGGSMCNICLPKETCDCNK